MCAVKKSFTVLFRTLFIRIVRGTSPNQITHFIANFSPKIIPSKDVFFTALRKSERESLVFSNFLSRAASHGV